MGAVQLVPAILNLIAILMQSSPFTALARSTFMAILFAVLLPPLNAAPEKSLLPVFGAEGDEFTTPAQKNHVIHGWLPKDWNDNSEWAPITATYSKLDDAPDKTGVALRIKVEKMDDGQLQLTSYAGERIYEKGRIYRVSGWVRCPDRVTVSVAARQSEGPYERYHEKDLATEATWKQFEFEFAPKNDIKAIIMFSFERVATVDLAGVTVTDEGSAQ